MTETYIDGLGAGVAGWAEWEDSPAELRMLRTATGFRLGLPLRIRARAERETPPSTNAAPSRRLVLTNLTAQVSVLSKAGEPLELGVARGTSTVIMGLPSSGHHLDLHLVETTATLAACERHRDGSEVRFDVVLSGTSVTAYGTAPHESLSSPNGFQTMFRAALMRDVWIRALRSVGASQLLCVEVPLSGTAPPGWESVWKAYEEARTMFDAGGPVGWAGCAARCREAFDQWDMLTPAKPVSGNRDLQTLPLRIAAIRDAVRHATHLGVHGLSESWTRGDALLFLSALSALLSRETMSS